ncbi:MFS transporter, partial [Bacillus cereus]|nr:MFS transporter [Bacillus cereus]
MSIFRSQNERETEKSIDKHALLFGLISVFLCGIGFSIIMPVVPFLVQPYT